MDHRDPAIPDPQESRNSSLKDRLKFIFRAARHDSWIPRRNRGLGKDQYCFFGNGYKNWRHYSSGTSDEEEVMSGSSCLHSFWGNFKVGPITKFPKSCEKITSYICVIFYCPAPPYLKQFCVLEVTGSRGRQSWSTAWWLNNEEKQKSRRDSYDW